MPKKKSKASKKAAKQDPKRTERAIKEARAEIAGRLGGKKEKAPPASKAKTPRPSALNAAAQVLVEVKRPMSSGDLIKEMAERKLWTSPNGKTPEATLYAAIVREISAKGKDARFVKTDRGMFAAATS